MTAADRAKTTAAGLVAAVGFYYSLLGPVTNPTSIRVAVFALTVAAACGLMYLSEPGKRFVAYARASAVEIRKVVWPGREEVVRMSGLVLVFVTIIAIFLWLVDSLLGWLLQFIAL